MEKEATVMRLLLCAREFRRADYGRIYLWNNKGFDKIVEVCKRDREGRGYGILLSVKISDKAVQGLYEAF